MKIYFIYPDKPKSISHVISAAIKKVGEHEINTWEENDIAGRPIITPILENIDSADAVFADISSLNFNVTFEIGYAIAKGKRVFLVRDGTLAKDVKIDAVGIYDTLGYKTYNNSDDLAAFLRKITDVEPLPVSLPQDRRAPLYVIESFRKNELTLTLLSKIKKTRLKFRSFNPTEDARLSAADAVQKAAASFGIVVPLLSENMEGQAVHNLRAAFVAGLGIGFRHPTLIVQYHGGPIPLDVRDFAITIAHPDDIPIVVNDFALEVTDRLQTFEEVPPPEPGTLASIGFGDPMAENEFETIGEYFLATDQYLKAERSEVHMVVGRKGTGKTAIFAQLRNQSRADSLNVVVDLRPEGYQVVKLKEQVLSKLGQGAKIHLIVAFWEYVLYLELLNKLLEKDRQRHLTDHRLFEPYKNLTEKYGQYAKFGEADFSERLAIVSEHVINEYQRRHGDSAAKGLTSEAITNLLYQVEIKGLRSDIAAYLRYKRDVLVLFDNLDRGWPEGGLTSDDILVIRCLIDASRKIQHEMRAMKIEFSSLVFLRNDVYQLLMNTSPDFGKDLRAQLDWTDADQIREVVRLRLIRNEEDKALPFDGVWRRICVSHINGEETSQYLIERSLYRPRNLLKLLYHCRAVAINLRKEIIDEDDIKKGLETFSTDLVIEANREISDVMPTAFDKIYRLLEESPRLTEEELIILFSDKEFKAEECLRLIQHCLYFGVLGLERNGMVRYIYDVGYDMKLLMTEIDKFRHAVRYYVHPAFWPHLKMKAEIPK